MTLDNYFQQSRVYAINDCFVDIFNRKPTKNEIKSIIEILPIAIINQAIQWGVE